MGPPDEIWVKAGTYSIPSTINVNKHVAIYGGFDGTETSVQERDWNTNRTVINGRDATRCLHITKHAIIDGFIIQHGYAARASGGGIYIDSPPLEYSSFPLNFDHVAMIRNCTLEYNTATVDEFMYQRCGGGIYDHESDPVIKDCIFMGNKAGSGGGICNVSSSPSGNHTDSIGGAIFSNMAGPHISNSIFWGDSPDELYFIFYRP